VDTINSKLKLKRMALFCRKLIDIALKLKKLGDSGRFKVLGVNLAMYSNLAIINKTNNKTRMRFNLS
jgi:hypothetical protein